MTHARRGRRALAAATVFASALVVGVALTAALSLSGGFERAAERADLPDLIVRFDTRARAEVDERIGALPNLEARAYRREVRRVPLSAGGQRTDRGALQVVEGGRRGYAVVEGRDVRGPSDVVVERGLAREWGLEIGDELTLFDEFEAEVVGIGLSPDNVAYPLTPAPRVFISVAALPPRALPLEVNVALAWLRDPAREDVTLAQARAVSFGLTDLRLLTRAGVGVLIGQAAGIVIALLVAFSVVAVGTAGVMLGASARSEVARRLSAIGVERAVGFSRARVALAQARGAVLLAAPAAAAGVLAGWLAVRGPSERLLVALNELGPGWPLAIWLALAWAALVALVAVASAWPAWRATGAPTAALLRGGELATGRRPLGRRRRRAPRDAVTGGSFSGLGARLAAARRGRLAATVLVLGAAVATVVLLLGLASLLAGLRDDPSTVGKRYALTASLDEDSTEAVRAIPGVADAAPRWAVDASSAYALGQAVRLIAFPGGAEDFEAPPLADGRRRSAPDEAEVGVGLADALGLRPGSTLAVALPGGGEVRFRVAGLVRALENDGRIAYVGSERLDAARALGPAQMAIALERGADRGRVAEGLLALGARPAEASAATTQDEAFLAVLAAVLRVVALTVALVCLLVLVQALVITARERRPTLALLRTVGAGRGELVALLGGACAVVLVPAAVLGVALEAIVLGPAVASLAAGYAGLSLAPTAEQLVLTVGGLGLLAVVAVAWVAARILHEPVVPGLRDQT